MFDDIFKLVEEVTDEKTGRVTKSYRLNVDPEVEKELKEHIEMTHLKVPIPNCIKRIVEK